MALTHSVAPAQQAACLLVFRSLFLMLLLVVTNLPHGHCTIQLQLKPQTAPSHAWLRGPGLGAENSQHHTRSSSTRLLSHQHQSQGPSPQQASPHAALFTYVASNASRYVQMASLQHLAARKYSPHSRHVVLVATSAGAQVANALRRSGARVELVEAFQEAHTHQGPPESSWLNQLTKVKLWTRTDYDLVCHLDSDVIFFSDVGRLLVQECAKHLLPQVHAENTALGGSGGGETHSSGGHRRMRRLFNASAAAAADEPLQYAAAHEAATHESGSAAADICGFNLEACSGPVPGGNTFKWDMPYMEASIFCLRPSQALYDAMLEAGVKRLQSERMIHMRGKEVFTEQDFLNLFFKGRIHYFPCDHGKGDIVHTKDVEGVWKQRQGGLPLYLFPIPHS